MVSRSPRRPPPTSTEPNRDPARRLHCTLSRQATRVAPRRFGRAVTDLPWRADPPPPSSGRGTHDRSSVNARGRANRARGTPGGRRSTRATLRRLPARRHGQRPSPPYRNPTHSACRRGNPRPRPCPRRRPCPRAGADRVVGVDRPVLAARMPGGLAPVASSAPDARIIRSDDPQKSAPPVLGRAACCDACALIGYPPRLCLHAIRPSRRPCRRTRAPSLRPRPRPLTRVPPRWRLCPQRRPRRACPLPCRGSWSRCWPSGPRSRTGSIDVALDPPELGRLRLSFGQAETGGALTLSIVARRPETADL